MATIFYDQDADPVVVKGRRVAVIGYGSQGHAHALNLSESGVEVRVGLRPGSKSREAAEQAGLRVAGTAEAADWADTVMMLVPDQHMASLYEAEVAVNLERGDALM
ncbi:MAG: NAD(P)-binding domain-containing protein, partial [Acidimicrobiia bacterium]